MAKRGEQSGEVRKSLWDVYLANRLCLHARNALVTYYLPLVSSVEHRFRNRGSLPNHVTAEQFCSWGVDGLMEAIERFDPERGVKFESVAIPLIGYRALDHMRSESPLSRNAMGRVRQYEQYRADFHEARGFDPTREEVCRALGFSDQQYRETIVAYGRYTASLSQLVFGSQEIKDNHDRTLVEFMVNKKAERPSRRVDRDLFFEKLTRGLDIEERIIVYLYHIKGRTMKEIGVSLDLHESRVSQMHSAIVERIQRKFRVDEAFALLSA